MGSLFPALFGYVDCWLIFMVCFVLVVVTKY